MLIFQPNMLMYKKTTKKTFTMVDSLHQLIMNKRRLYKVYKKYRNNTNYLKYCEVRNEVTKNMKKDYKR